MTQFIQPVVNSLCKVPHIMSERGTSQRHFNIDYRLWALCSNPRDKFVNYASLTWTRVTLHIVLFTLAVSIVMRPRGHDMPQDLSFGPASAQTDRLLG